MTSLYRIGSSSRPARLPAAVAAALAAVVLFAAVGCARNNGKPQATALITGVKVTPLHDQHGTAAPSQGIQLAGGGNEWVSFSVQLTGLPAGAAREQLAVAVTPLSGPSVSAAASVSGADIEAYQLIDMPVDAARADHVRHVGQVAGDTHLPRALLPVAAADGRFPLAGLRPGVFTPAPAATQPATSPAATTAKIWVDVRVPKGAAAGKYASAVQVVQKVDGKLDWAKGAPAGWLPVASVPIELTVHNFALPDERGLKLVGQVSWESLVRHYEGDFEAVSPHLLARGDARYAQTVATLDALMAVAQRHRVSLVYPRLQPTVKWPALIEDAPPEVRWQEFDSLATPWLSGSAFADGVGVGYWQVPEPDELQRYDPRSRLAYWNQAAMHFDERSWLGAASVALRTVTPGRPRGADAIELSAEAAQLLAAHSRVEVSVPLEDDQVQVATGDRAAAAGRTAIDPLHARRLRTAAPGLIAGRQDWPDGVDEPRHWLRTDLPGLVSADGAARDNGGGGVAVAREEQDVRLWAWLAFLRRADQVVFGQALPSHRDARAAADPAELVWFYPGHWFGVAEPVPTVQLKWLRGAQQDYEYLNLARQREQGVNALWMARVLTKPVEIGLGQVPDPAYTLMSGTADPRAWAEARRLLVKAIGLRSGGIGEIELQAARDALDVEILQWIRPQERPLLIGRSTAWSWSRRPDGQAWVQLELGLDVYNASDVEPGQNQLRWSSLPPGWEVRPQPTAIPKLDTYRVLRTGLSANFGVSRTTPAARRPAEIDLTVDSPSAKFVSQLKLALPVAATDRREGRFAFDGRLDDWTEVDRIHDGPLVRMLTRPAVLTQAVEPASTPSRVYTNWTPDNLFVAFAVEGVGRPDAGGAGYKNFVDYQARRAWGEDLCEVLVQPVYKDSSLGPVLHVVVKPNGSNWVERKLDPKLNADPWEPFESTGTKYAAQVSADKWTGELSIPWRVMADRKLGMPTLLRFNFSQHRPSAGESASWAGPVDFGRDDALTGLLHLKLPLPGGAGDAVQGGPNVPGPIER